MTHTEDQYIVQGSKQFFVYIISNKYHTTLYTGMTNNLKRRITEHKEGLADSFASRYQVKYLMYYEIFGDPLSAIEREKQVKKYSAKKKIALIEKLNPDWKDLFDDLP